MTSYLLLGREDPDGRFRDSRASIIVVDCGFWRAICPRRRVGVLLLRVALVGVLARLDEALGAGSKIQGICVDWMSGCVVEGMAVVSTPRGLSRMKSKRASVEDSAWTDCVYILGILSQMLVCECTKSDFGWEMS